MKTWFISDPITIRRNQWRMAIIFDPRSEKNRIRFQFQGADSKQYAPDQWIDESYFPRDTPRSVGRLLTLNRRKVDNLCPWL